MWGEVLHSLATLRKAAGAERKNPRAAATIHSRVRPHVEVLQATDHNLSRMFSPSTKVKAYVYVQTLPDARAKIHPRATTRQDRYVEKR
jgi:hypothetical protein